MREDFERCDSLVLLVWYFELFGGDVAFSVGEPGLHGCFELLGDTVVAFSVGEPVHGCFGLLCGDAVVAFSVGEPRGMNKRFAGGGGLLETAASRVSHKQLFPVTRKTHSGEAACAPRPCIKEVHLTPPRPHHRD
jgi:hypothetical protein